MLRKPNLLLLYVDAPSRIAHLRKLRQLQVNIILASDDLTWQKPYIDDYVRVDFNDIESSLRKIIAYNKNCKIDGILTTSDDCLQLGAMVGKELNLPFVSPETVRLAINKPLMKERFDKYHIPSAKYAVASSIENALCFAADAGYPLIVKPTSGGGNAYVRRVENDSELRKYVSKFKEPVLVEEYLRGVVTYPSLLGLRVGEVCVEGYTVNGKTQLISVVDQPLVYDGPYFEDCCWCAPSRHSAKTIRQLAGWMNKINESMALKSGFSHAEFRITEDGPKVIETSVRIGGGPIYRTVLNSTGVDFMEALVSAALGEKPKIKARLKRPTVTVALWGERGYISKISGIGDALKTPGLVELHLYDAVGDCVKRAPESSRCNGHAILSAGTFRETEMRSLQVLDSLKIQTQPTRPAKQGKSLYFANEQRQKPTILEFATT